MAVNPAFIVRVFKLLAPSHDTVISGGKDGYY
jgi:hypothetical protein